MIAPPTIVLASASPRRREILTSLGLEFRVEAPEGVDESLATGAPADFCRELALAKAWWVASRLLTPGIVIGCDTIVAVRDAEDDDNRAAAEHILGKPVDDDDARRTIRLLSGRSHRVLSGVAVHGPGGFRVAVETSEVVFRDLADAEIDAYIATGDHRGKAGAYGIQSEGRKLIAGFRGCYYNIVGLPWRRLAELLPAGLLPAACDCANHRLQRGTPGCVPKLPQEAGRPVGRS